MPMFRKHRAQVTSQGESEARQYAAKLVWPAALVGLSLHYPMTQWSAALLVASLVIHVIVAGKSFRIHQPDFAAIHPFWKQLWVFRSAAKFIVVATIVFGVALALTPWGGKTVALHAVLDWLMTFNSMTIHLWH